jgi:hypothetical protein
MQSAVVPRPATIWSALRRRADAVEWAVPGGLSARVAVTRLCVNPHTRRWPL